jgi:competence protein ComEC
MKGQIFVNIVWLVIGVIYLISVRYVDTVVFLDVGQGDATLIQNGSVQLLVDGGPDSKILYELGKYIPFYDKEIEYVLLTHPHDDHLVGLLDVLERYEVGEILYFPVCFENEDYEFLIQEYDNLRVVGAGDTIRLKDIQIDILWPVLSKEWDSCIEMYNGNLNNDSLVLSFNFLNRDFLLMGDIESDAEEILLEQGIVTGEYDILKAGHHCSSTSSSETFLKTVSPDIAVCSVGESNKFGHPSSETLENFSKHNVQYLITYEEGNIQIK